MSSPSVRRTFSAKCSAAVPLIWTSVTLSRMRMLPMSSRVTLPRRHSMGSSHFGSALLRRPISTRNSTMPPSSAPCLGACSRAPGRSRSKPRSARSAPYLERVPLSNQEVGSETSSGAGRRERQKRASMAAISCGVRSAINSSAMTRSSSLGSSRRAGSSIRRWRSSLRMSSAVGGSVQRGSMPASASRPSALRRRAGGTITTLTPLRPARPVRPLRCWRISASWGSSA